MGLMGLLATTSLPAGKMFLNPCEFIGTKNFTG